MIARQIALITWLTLLWLVLWRDFNVTNTLSGLATAVVVTTIFPGIRGRPRQHTVHVGWLLAFLFYFHWKLLEANVVLAREILTPRDHTLSGIIAVPVEGSSDLVITIIANAITLTPGTVTLEVTRDPAVLYVHVLHLLDTERVRDDVRKLEHFALRAMGAEDVLADDTLESDRENS